MRPTKTWMGSHRILRCVTDVSDADSILHQCSTVYWLSRPTSTACTTWRTNLSVFQNVLRLMTIHVPWGYPREIRDIDPLLSYGAVCRWDGSLTGSTLPECTRITHSPPPTTARWTWPSSSESSPSFVANWQAAARQHAEAKSSSLHASMDEERLQRRRIVR